MTRNNDSTEHKDIIYKNLYIAKVDLDIECDDNEAESDSHFTLINDEKILFNTI